MGDGLGKTVIVTAEDVAVQLFASVTVTVYCPPVDTFIERALMPFDHAYVENSPVESVMVSPSHMDKLPLAVIIGWGKLCTVT